MYKVECETITKAHLTLDQWRPITPEQFLSKLTDSAFYDGEFYVPPVSQNVELENDTHAIVWCCGVDMNHEKEDTVIMAPMLLVLVSWNRNNKGKRALCFERT